MYTGSSTQYTSGPCVVGVRINADLLKVPGASPLLHYGPLLRRNQFVRQKETWSSPSPTKTQIASSEARSRVKGLMYLVGRGGKTCSSQAWRSDLDGGGGENGLGRP